MAHLNCLPPRAEGVNDWFFLLAHLVVGVGIKQNAKCEILLRKIDGEMNVHNCGFAAKWRRWRHAPRLTATAVITDSGHSLSKRWHVADVKNITGNDQTTLMVYRNSANIAYTFRIYICLRLCDRDCCSAADGSGSCHAPAPSYFEDITRCRRQQLHWRGPGNPNGRSKFCNLALFMFTRSQIMLRRRLRGWWRLPEIAQTALGRRQKHRRRLTALRTVYFPAITRNGFCVHIRKIISWRPWPHRKTEIYIL